MSTLRFQIIDAVRRRDGALQGRGDETAYQGRVGADVDGGDRDAGVVAARILPYVEGKNCLLYTSRCV